MKDIVADASLVTKCGLYCGACKAYLKGKCEGCAETLKKAKCKIRNCCVEHNYTTCADCETYTDTSKCKKMNGGIDRFFSLIFRYDRAAGIQMVRKQGAEAFAEKMTADKSMWIKK